MQLNNPFPPEVRNLYLYVYACMDCGRSDRGLELHHITGRCSASKLNGIVLCIICHGKCCHSREEEKRYSQITIRFHLSERNTLSTEDIMYYNNNRLLYE